MLHRRWVPRRVKIKCSPMLRAFLAREPSRGFAMIPKPMIPLCNQRSINFPGGGWKTSSTGDVSNVNKGRRSETRDNRDRSRFPRNAGNWDVTIASNPAADHVSSTARLKIKQLSGTCSKIAQIVDKTTLSPKTPIDAENLHKFPTNFVTFQAKVRQFHSLKKLKQENFHLHLNLNPRLEQFWWRTEENVSEFFFVLLFLIFFFTRRFFHVKLAVYWMFAERSHDHTRKDASL